MYDDIAQPEPPSAGTTPDLDAWKQRLRQQFEAWLESMEPESEIPEQTDAPDLYSLFEELTALRNETRTGNRKSAEVFSRFGESLDRFQVEIRRMGEEMRRVDAARQDKAALPRSYFLALVEMADRMHRLGSALERPPQAGLLAFLSFDAPWKKAWANWRDGFSILVSHFEKLLEQTGVQRLNTVGRPFDPITMVAVATIAPGDRLLNVVVEEVAPGYLWYDEILRPAEVKITKSPS